MKKEAIRCDRVDGPERALAVYIVSYRDHYSKKV